ncbi:hypothetical protein Tco_1317546 [Tanacetum coccineum]
MEEEKSVESNEVVGKNVVEPNKSNITEPIVVADRKDEIKYGTNDEPDRSAEKGLMGEKVRELVETPRFNDSLLAMQSGKMECEAYHSLPIEPMRKAMLKKMITKKEDMGVRTSSRAMLAIYIAIHTYIVMSDSEDSTVTYTEAPPSPDYVPGLEEPEQAPPSPVYVPYVPEPAYPKFMPPEDEEEDDDEDLEEDPADYPADGGDDGESSEYG